MKTNERLELSGLRPAPCQVWGQVRLLPLVGPSAEGPRVHPLCLGGEAQVRLSGRPGGKGLLYSSFIPSGFVFARSSEEALAASELWVGERGEAPGGATINRLRQEKGGAMRILPLHSAVEGLLARRFRGSDVARKGWSAAFLRSGLSPRSESFIPARAIPDLEEALRHFELLPEQRGMLLFAGELLVSAVVLPHCEDYAELHLQLLQDHVPQVFLLWSLHQLETAPGILSLRAEAVVDLDSLAAELERGRVDWAQTVEQGLASGLIGRNVQMEELRVFRGAQLCRFLTGLDPQVEQHVGELMREPGGRLLYLKTLHLGRDQVERAAFIELLAEEGWSLPAIRARLGLDGAELRQRFARLGLAWMLG
jgi:hypothetical protein